jgi:hypothetical protein
MLILIKMRARMHPNTMNMSQLVMITDHTKVTKVVKSSEMLREVLNIMKV